MRKTLEIIEFFQPARWWIETPATGLLARSETMAGYAYVDCDQCQFSDYGYQKPTRFFGSEHLRLLEPVLCDQRTCSSLVDDPENPRRRRRHKNRLGGNNGYVQKELAYRLPPSLVEYVSGLSGLPERKCGPAGSLWRSQDYAVQPERVRLIVEKLQVQPTVDAFSAEKTARFERFWGPGSSEAADAFTQSWSSEVLWANPPFALLHKVLAKVIKDEAHAVVVLPEWPNKSFFALAKKLEIASVRFGCDVGIFERHGRPLKSMRWNVQAIFVCGNRAKCPIHGPGQGGDASLVPGACGADNRGGSAALGSEVGHSSDEGGCTPPKSAAWDDQVLVRAVEEVRCMQLTDGFGVSFAPYVVGGMKKMSSSRWILTPIRKVRTRSATWLWLFTSWKHRLPSRR